MKRRDSETFDYPTAIKGLCGIFPKVPMCHVWDEEIQQRIKETMTVLQSVYLPNPRDLTDREVLINILGDTKR